MKKRYTLNVSKEVYMALMDLRAAELRKSGKVVTVDEILSRQLRVKQVKG